MKRILLIILLFGCDREDIVKFASDTTDTCTVKGIDAIECQDVQSECIEYDGFFQFHEPDSEYFCSCDC